LVLLTADELQSQPMPSALIDGVLYGDSLAVLVGPHSSFKTFIALSMAVCIAGGVPWFGRPTTRGNVVYVAAEGAAGLSQRLTALCSALGIEKLESFYALCEAVPLTNRKAARELADVIDQRLIERPVLIVIDTLNRNFQGDENSSADMGRFVEGLDHLRQRTGATVEVVHHTGRSGDHSRGSTVLPGAVDTEISIERHKAGNVTLKCTKQRNGEPFAAITLTPKPHGPSLVLSLDNNKVERSRQSLTSNEQEALKSLNALAHDSPASSTKWMMASGITSSGSFNNARKALLARGYVAPVGKRYAMTDAGRAAVAQSLNGRSTGTQIPARFSLTHSSEATRASEVERAGDGGA
jgi:RecA-family ATPase